MGKVKFHYLHLVHVDVEYVMGTVVQTMGENPRAVFLVSLRRLNLVLVNPTACKTK